MRKQGREEIAKNNRSECIDGGHEQAKQDAALPLNSPCARVSVLPVCTYIESIAHSDRASGAGRETRGRRGLGLGLHIGAANLRVDVDELVLRDDDDDDSSRHGDDEKRKRHHEKSRIEILLNTQ
jgi:hypothetical protein